MSRDASRSRRWLDARVFQASPLSLDRAFWFLEPCLPFFFSKCFFCFSAGAFSLRKTVSVSHHGFFFAYNGVCMRARVCMALVAAGRKKGGKQPCEKTIVSKPLFIQRALRERCPLSPIRRVCEADVYLLACGGDEWKVWGTDQRGRMMRRQDVQKKKKKKNQATERRKW